MVTGILDIAICICAFSCLCAERLTKGAEQHLVACQGEYYNLYIGRFVICGTEGGTLRGEAS